MKSKRSEVYASVAVLQYCSPVGLLIETNINIVSNISISSNIAKVCVVARNQ